VATIIDTPDPLLGKDIPLGLSEREPHIKVDGTALISNNKIIAAKRFDSGGRYVIPGDELYVKWEVQEYHPGFSGGDPILATPEETRRFALKKIAESEEA